MNMTDSISNGIIFGFDIYAVLPMIRYSFAAIFIVICAMGIDLIAGIYKAKQRGEMRSSEALKRTGGKFITYIGAMFIAFGVDLLFYMSNITAVIRLDVLHGVPFITCMMGVFFLVVEFLSVKEKASDKQKKAFSKATEVLNVLMKDKDLRDIVRGILEQKAAEDGCADDFK